MSVAILPEELAAMANELDIDDARAVSAYPVPAERDDFAVRVRKYPIELGYVHKGVDRRFDPDQVLPGVRSVIVTAVSYNVNVGTSADVGDGETWISRHAFFRDYHKTVGARVKALAQGIERRYGARTRWYVDTGPVLEKAYAVASGMGWFGKNGLFIHKSLGSFVFLGVILTDLEIAVDYNGPERDGRQTPRTPLDCGTCNLCARACPTNALDNPGRVDVSLCLGHLTVTSKEVIPEGLDLGDNLYGCDRCQEVCPFNLAVPFTKHPEFMPLPGLLRPRIDDILAMDQTTFDAVFGTTPIRRRGLKLVKQTAGLVQRQQRRPQNKSN